MKDIRAVTPDDAEFGNDEILIEVGNVRGTPIPQRIKQSDNRVKTGDWHDNVMEEQRIGEGPCIT